MSFASGFFNSVDHDRLYDATDISRLFDGLIRDGIFASIGDCLVVKQSNQMNVTVGTGRAWFNHTWSYNDALYPVTIPPSEILMDRIDAIVLEINSVESVRANSIKLIKGTPASTPTKPTLTNTKEVHQYPLAYVTVGKEVTSIRQADIENCVGTSACPFVTGILEVISIEQLIPQWRDILNRFVEENTANFNTWMNGEKQDYKAWLAAAKKEIKDWEATSKSDYQKWYDSIKNGYDQWFATIKAAYDANWSTFQQWEKTSQTEFDTWFENMKNKLEGDLGAKLTLETEKLGKEKVSLIESTKTDLKGTVEAPLMIGKATRNLLNPSLLTIRENDLKDSGITATINSNGSITLNGTATRSIWSLLYTTYGSGNNNMFKGLRVFTNLKYNGSDKYGDLYVAYCKDNDGKKEIWRSRQDRNLIPDGNGEPCLVRLHISSGATFNNETFFIMFTDDEEGAVNDELIPYSGYDIKTCGKNLLPYPYYRGSSHTTNGITFTVDLNGTIHASGTASNTAYYALHFDGLIPCLTVGNKYTMTLSVRHGKASIYLANNKNNENTNIAGIRNLTNDTKSTTFTFTRIDGANDQLSIYISSGTTLTDCQIKVQLEEGETATDIEQYKTSTTKITKDTEFPNFDLKSFDGATHIISPGNVQSFHADAPNGKYLLESIKKSAESGGVSYGAIEPTNPKPGDLWINPASGGRMQYWTGSKWDVPRALDAMGSDVVKSNRKPSPKKSTLWIDSGNGNAMKHVANDGTVTELSSGGTYYGSTAPTDTKLLWIDTSGVARFYNGSAWKTLTPTWG